MEDRRSALGALVASVRFVRRHAAAVLALYALNAACSSSLVALYAVWSPAARRQGRAMWHALVVGELYILARHYLKLAFYASETALFQARLAHAGYTAAPPVVWPDSPAAEVAMRSTRSRIRP